MNSFIRHIGIIDRDDKVHAVTFGPGLNVITGKSSTGKSAMIEIFDYCFGSSDFTVPEGVITKESQLYFVVMRVKRSNLILARKADERRAFIKEETDDSFAADLKNFRMAYFDSAYFIPLPDFKDQLGRHFGLTLTNVEEGGEIRPLQRKSPTPSVRSFASFMLQHQNLIANKHAVFYRFDEKEKREQAIEHFKIFAGFVDQTYFLKCQELNELKLEEKKIQQQLPRMAELQVQYASALSELLRNYSAVTGNTLEIGDGAAVMKQPAVALKKLRETKILLLPTSNQHAAQREEYERAKAQLVAELRKHQQQLASIHSSIHFAKGYMEDVRAIGVPTQAELTVSTCPFCQTAHDRVEREANKLQEAINWLNDELHRSPYMLDSFEEEQTRAEREIEQLKTKITEIDKKISVFEEQIRELQDYRTQQELALKAKLEIERLLENQLSLRSNTLESQLVKVRKQIATLEKALRDLYGVEGKIADAEKSIDELMRTLGATFDFEDSYRPINLRFSLKTFDLWHETPDKKVFLRSMGSGANWLYCHVTLFLALHRFFCSLGEKCCIPSILFLDQPSQVYFPSIIDDAPEFDPNDLAKRAGVKKAIDEDVRAVTNLYSQLSKFCKETLAKTGIEPQLIVTDHADHLKIEEDIDFESLVQGRRWRKRGFISFEPKTETNPR